MIFGFECIDAVNTKKNWYINKNNILKKKISDLNNQFFTIEQ
jgi:hypothetical protein